MTRRAASRSHTVACCICGVELRRFTESPYPMCRECGAYAVRTRFELEREGVLPPHGRDLRGVYTCPAVLDRVREAFAAERQTVGAR
jgi:hypothetical protein